MADLPRSLEFSRPRAMRCRNAGRLNPAPATPYARKSRRRMPSQHTWLAITSSVQSSQVSIRAAHLTFGTRSVIENEFFRVEHNPQQLAHARRSEEHTSELQSLTNLVCRLLLE